jgi:serine/threonine protein kinase
MVSHSALHRQSARNGESTTHYEGKVIPSSLFESKCCYFHHQMDIYSFGMCVLVLIIRDEPYADCHGDIKRIARRAARGIAPRELGRIQSSMARDFISSCLRVNPEERLSAEELLEHQFLQPDEELDDKEVAVGERTTCSILLLP